MRKRGLILGAGLVLGLAGSLAAQQPVTFNTGFKPATSNVQAIDINAMLPKVNINQAIPGQQQNSRTFNFSKMLPNFSFLQNPFQAKRGYSQFDPRYYGPYYQQPKKK